MDSGLQKAIRTAEWVHESPLGDRLVPMTAIERKSVTKVFGSTTPQKQSLIQVKDTTLCLSEDAYLHTTKDSYTNQDHQPGETFERNGLSSLVDNEMRRLQRSKFLNTKLSSLDAGGIRWQKRDNGGLVEDSRRGMSGKEEVERNRGVCEVEGIVVKNNNEKLGKYSRGPRNIPNSRDADSLY